MSGNVFGNFFQFMTFGESHGAALGAVVSGVPAGLDFERDELQQILNRRRPGTSDFVSSRKESDEVKILSGIFENKTLGTPICAVVENRDARSADYEKLEPRTGHADKVWLDKYGHVDSRGGGRSSGRETLSRVVAGYFARKALQQKGFADCEVISFTKQIADQRFKSPEVVGSWNITNGFGNSLNLSSEVGSETLKEMLLSAKENGESFGGVVGLKIFNSPKNLGQPVFGKIKSRLADAYMGLGAVNGIYLGDVQPELVGTQYHKLENSPYGGIQGGISTGKTIDFKVFVKATSSILDVSKKGRHDPSIVPRIGVVLEAMTWCVLYDLYLEMQGDRIS